MVGSSIGPYFVVEQLGAGGMGEVFLAHDTRLNRRVALKILSEPALDAPHARQRLLHEARASARLAHPNIAAVYDVLDCDAGPCIVMEYVQGETLAARLQHGPLPCAQALSIGVQLADGLAHAHAAGVVHRDLKPANVILMADGRVKILDFGLARVHEIEAENDLDDRVPDAGASSRAHRLTGTPGYMAPEQLLGRPVTPLTDVYALGVLLFELLSGRRPFAGGDFMALGMAVLVDRTPELPIDPARPDEVRRIIARAMAKEPAERYQSAGDLSSALRRVSQKLCDQPTVSQTAHFGELASSETADATGGLATRPWRTRSFRIAAVVSLAVVVTLVALLLMRRGAEAPQPVPGTQGPVVAVLPLANLSGDGSRDYVGVGVAESLITSLAGAPGVTVVSQNETGRYLAHAEDAGTITRALGATLLVDGGVQQVGDGLRFTLKVLRPDSRVVWASTYQGAMSDLFEMQAHAAGELAAALGVTLAPEVIARAHPASVGAYADYSMGRALLARQDVPGNAERAVASFGRAVEKDPRFALAWAGLGEASWWRYKETNDATWVPRATDAIRRALALDPLEPRIHVALANVDLGTGKSQEAVAELRSAIARRPNDDEAHRLLADALASQGRAADALREYQKAIAVRPNYFRNYSALGGFHFRAGRYADATAAFERVTEIQPDSTWGFINLGAAYLAAGDTRHALENFQRSLTLAPEPEAYSNIGTIHYTEGRYQEAAVAYERAVGLAPRNPISHRNLGDAYLRLGARDKARVEYQRASDLTADLLKVNPRDARLLASRSLYLAKAGRGAEALRDAVRAVAIAPADPKVLYTRAAVHALCGQQSAAADWLQRALARGYSRTLAAEDDDLASIRKLPQVQSALGRARVP